MPNVGPEQLELEAAPEEPTTHGRANGHPDPERRRAAAELLETHGALLTRSHLSDLGLERRAVDAVFRILPVVALPGYSRPMIRAEEYLALVEQHTYRDDRIRPTHAWRLDHPSASTRRRHHLSGLLSARRA
jgi:hypothetical protein